MKKFRYNLESVLEYEQRILDDLKEQYAVRERAVTEKQEQIRSLQAKRDALQDEFQHVKEQGAPIEKFLLYSNLIDRDRSSLRRSGLSSLRSGRMKRSRRSSFRTLTSTNLKS